MSQPRPRLYQFGQRPNCFSLPLRPAWAIACAECAAAWLQPSFDYIKVQRLAFEGEDCQICQYLEGLEGASGDRSEVEAILATEEVSLQQLRMF